MDHRAIRWIKPLWWIVFCDALEQWVNFTESSYCRLNYPRIKAILVLNPTKQQIKQNKTKHIWRNHNCQAQQSSVLFNGRQQNVDTQQCNIHKIQLLPDMPKAGKCILQPGERLGIKNRSIKEKLKR